MLKNMIIKNFTKRFLRENINLNSPPIYYKLILIILLLINCSTKKEITKLSESEFYSLWDQSIEVPKEGKSESTKSQPQPTKKK